MTRALPRRFEEFAAPPRSGWPLWERCCAGREPAESLHPRDREDLVAGLHQQGFTDLDIAERTRLSTYTTARIRARLGLAPNLDCLRRRAAS